MANGAVSGNYVFRFFCIQADFTADRTAVSGYYVFRFFCIQADFTANRTADRAVGRIDGPALSGFGLP